MSVITVAAGGASREQVVEALREALGPRYHVLSGAAFDHSARDGLAADELDTIVVGTGSDRWVRAQVTIARRSDTTRLHVIPGGYPATWIGIVRLINRLGIARRVTNVLEAALGPQ